MAATIRIGELRAPWLFWAALAVGAAYMIPVTTGAFGPAIVLWKGAGVGLLALWAAVNARERHGQMIAVALGFGALGDILIETSGLVVGAIAFSVGHMVAIGLYRQNRRDHLTPSQHALSILIVPLALIIAAALLISTPIFAGALFYTMLLSLMAASAWESRFSRYRTGLGAMLFLISDLLIFAQAGGTVDPAIGGMLVWSLYFAGQALIAWGVVPVLAARHR